MLYFFENGSKGTLVILRKKWSFPLRIFCSFLRIWSHLLNKSLMENFIFCAVNKLPQVLGICQRQVQMLGNPLEELKQFYLIHFFGDSVPALRLLFFIGSKNPIFPLIKRSWINSFIFSFPIISTRHILLQQILSIFSPLRKLIG